MPLKENQKIVLYMNDGVKIEEYHSIIDAYYGIQKDVKNMIDGLVECGETKTRAKKIASFNSYYYELETETEDTICYQEVKITRRRCKNKYRYYCKPI